MKLVAEPLPECDLCAQPTHRDTWEQNGHLCTPCSTGIADTVRMVPVRRVVHLDSERLRRRRLDDQDQALTDETAFVEGFRPPVPGQLEILEPGEEW